MHRMVEVDARHLNHIRWLLTRLLGYVGKGFFASKINEIIDQLDCIINGDTNSV